MLPNIFSQLTNSSSEFLASVVSRESEARRYWVGRSRVPFATHGPPGMWRDPSHGFIELCRLDAFHTCHQIIPPVDPQHSAVQELRSLQDLPEGIMLFVIYIYYVQTVSPFLQQYFDQHFNHRAVSSTQTRSSYRLDRQSSNRHSPACCPSPSLILSPTPTLRPETRSLC